jgi:Na+-transporting NADH:ubiquinone oxidoreductase subunit C
VSSNDSIKKTLIVAFSLCIVCSVIVSTAAVLLKPTQEINKTLDRKRNILAAAGMLQEGVSVEDQFAQGRQGSGRIDGAECRAGSSKNIPS